MTRCVLFILLLAQPASGIVINVDPWPSDVQFPSGSLPTDFEPHTDPGSAHLLNTMNAAARIWGDAIRDPVTVSVVVFWEFELGSLGLYQAIPKDGLGNPIPNPVTGGPVIENLIRFDNAADYYLDPTPGDPFDDGFVFKSTISDGTEAGFSGSRPSTGKADLLSLALHEVGHALGLASHLPHSASLMSGLSESDLTDRRYLPSATDILSIASAGGYTDIHLPRGALPPPGSGVVALVMLWLLLPVRAGKAGGG